MILIDTSIWIDHFRKTNASLIKLLESEQVVIHPFVLGELACGDWKNRKEIVSLLHALPHTTMADNEEILFLIEKQNLYGRGVGLVDVHLLASCLTDHHKLWTNDKRLKAIAATLSVAA